MKSYRCPVCRKPLTKRQYERALGILGERERHLRHQHAELRSKLRTARAREKSARQEGINVERARTQWLLRGKDRQIAVLKERLDQLKRGSTPQTEGLEFEDKLASRLKREFPEDLVEHKGKGGDVLQHVRFDGKVAGLIVYECKRSPKIMAQHLRQTHAARQSREADFAVLVTTGQKAGFSGLARLGGVLVVSPLATIPLAHLLRAHLLEMLKAKIGKERRALIAQQLVRFVAGPQFRNPIQEVIQISTDLQDMVKDEAKAHFRTWQKRWQHYQTINWDTTQIQKNVQTVLHGKKPMLLQQPRGAKLALPPVSV